MYYLVWLREDSRSLSMERAQLVLGIQQVLSSSRGLPRQPPVRSLLPRRIIISKGSNTLENPLPRLLWALNQSSGY